MQLGIKKGSSKEITIIDLQKALVAKKEKNPQMDPIRIFCEVCREVANANKMDCTIHLEGALSFENGSVELMNAYFKKW